MSWNDLARVTLADDHVLLRRIRAADREQLQRIAFDERIWEFFVSQVKTEDDLDSFLEEAIRDTLLGVRNVFVIV